MTPPITPVLHGLGAGTTSQSERVKHQIDCRRCDTRVEDNMATSVLRISVLLAVLVVTDGQSTTSENTHCSYTFKVPTNDCGQTIHGRPYTPKDFRKLTDEKTKLQQEITTLKADNCENTFAAIRFLIKTYRYTMTFTLRLMCI